MHKNPSTHIQDHDKGRLTYWSEGICIEIFEAEFNQGPTFFSFQFLEYIYIYIYIYIYMEVEIKRNPTEWSESKNKIIQMVKCSSFIHSFINILKSWRRFIKTEMFWRGLSFIINSSLLDYYVFFIFFIYIYIYNLTDCHKFISTSYSRQAASSDSDAAESNLSK